MFGGVYRSVRSESTNVPEYKGPTRKLRPRNPTSQLCRYLIDITALTFCVDFDKLDSALLEQDIKEGTTSTLSDDGRHELLELSSLVLEAHNRNSCNQAIAKEDMRTLREAIIDPGSLIDTGVNAFALNVIGFYKQLAAKPEDWSLMLLRHRATAQSSFYPGVEGSLKSFERLI